MATVGGTQILLSYTTLLFAALFAVILGPQVEAVRPGLGPLRYVAGAVFAVLLYAAVLLHEISHALVARRYGTQVPSITLHFLGGMTAVQGESRSPRQEFWVAVVGPLTSLAVGGVAWLAYTRTEGGLSGLFLFGLAAGNLLIGVLNLVPGLPLDGGRVLKALVWAASGSALRGVVVAAWAGRATAVALALWPVVSQLLRGTGPDLVQYAVFWVLAAFVWTTANAELGGARLRARFTGLVARDLARRPLRVARDLPLAEAVRRAREDGAGAILTVAGDGSPEGLVSEAAVQAVPEERRPWVPTASVARSLTPDLCLPAALEGEALVLALDHGSAREYLLVEEDGAVHGVLALADVDRALRGTRGGA